MEGHESSKRWKEAGTAGGGTIETTHSLLY